MVLGWLLIGVACNSAPTVEVTRPPNQKRDRLVPVAMTDQHGRTILLSSLKGKFVLVDFIYASCPGTCLLTTKRMSDVAKALGVLVGTQLTLVSFTVDPEHDGTAELLDYSQRERAERPGWLFLTGAPAKIDEVLSAFNLPRQKQPDGVIDHITYCFLLGPDGREEAMYDPLRASSEAIALAIKGVMMRASRRGLPA